MHIYHVAYAGEKVHNSAMLSTEPSTTIQALSALVQLGASDQLLGLAVRELIPPGALPQETTFPGARAAQADVPPPVASSSGDAGQHPHRPALTPPPFAPLVTMQLAKRKTEIVNFRNPDGSRSSVGFAPGDWDELLKQAEGRPEVLKAQIRNFAGKAPPDSNRSKWTYDKIMGQGRP